MSSFLGRKFYRSTLYIYIYIQISLNIIDIFCRHILLLILSYCLYWFYSIRRELIDMFSIIVYFPSTFCPTLGNHQGKMYYKSDATFVCTLLLCKKKSIWAVAVCSVYLGNTKLCKIYQSILAEYYKINTAIWKDQQENMQTENVNYVQRNLY